MNDNFAGYPMHGLVGQTGDYAFSMNSLHLPTTLMPLVKYEPVMHLLWASICLI